MAIRVVKVSALVWLKRGIFGWLLGWLKPVSFGSYNCGLKGAVLGGY